MSYINHVELVMDRLKELNNELGYACGKKAIRDIESLIFENEKMLIALDLSKHGRKITYKKLPEDTSRKHLYGNQLLYEMGILR